MDFIYFALTAVSFGVLGLVVGAGCLLSALVFLWEGDRDREIARMDELVVKTKKGAR